jgi:hypothetical protein
MIVPGKLLAFDRPSDLALQRGLVRRYLHRHGREPGAACGWGVVAWGMEVEDLTLASDHNLSLADVDRFLSLVRLSPGVVAM